MQDKHEQPRLAEKEIMDANKTTRPRKRERKNNLNSVSLKRHRDHPLITHFMTNPVPILHALRRTTTASENSQNSGELGQRKISQ